MAGVLLMLFGFARLGGAIKFIPYPVTIGFTAGIALIIFSSQVKDFLGLRMGAVPAEFLEKWQVFGTGLGTLNPWALAGSLLTLGIILGLAYVHPRPPRPFVAPIVTPGPGPLLP